MTDLNEYAAALPAPIDSDAEPLETSEPGMLSVSDLTALDWDGDGGGRACRDAESVRHDNTRRAGFALSALEAYADRVGGLVSDPAEQQLRDLLADTMHLIAALDLNFGDLLDQAYGRYHEERSGTL